MFDIENFLFFSAIYTSATTVLYQFCPFCDPTAFLRPKSQVTEQSISLADCRVSLSTICDSVTRHCYNQIIVNVLQNLKGPSKNSKGAIRGSLI